MRVEHRSHVPYERGWLRRVFGRYVDLGMHNTVEIHDAHTDMHVAPAVLARTVERLLDFVVENRNMPIVARALKILSTENWYTLHTSPQQIRQNRDEKELLRVGEHSFKIPLPMYMTKRRMRDLHADLPSSWAELFPNYSGKIVYSIPSIQNNFGRQCHKVANPDFIQATMTLASNLFILCDQEFDTKEHRAEVLAMLQDARFYRKHGPLSIQGMKDAKREWGDFLAKIFDQ